MDPIYRTSPEGYLEYSPAFFQQCMREFLDDPELAVTAADFISEVGVTATTRMKYSGEKDKLLGLFHYRVAYTSRGQARAVDILVKAKEHYRQLVERLAEVLEKSGVHLPDLAAWLGRTELFNTHMKEIYVFRMQKTDPAFRAVLPVIYGTYVNDATETYCVLEEFLGGCYVIQDYTDISYWNTATTRAALLGFTTMHAAYYDRWQPLAAQGWLGRVTDAALMQQLVPLWSAYADRMQALVPAMFDAAYLDQHRRWIATIPDWWGRIDALPKTLIFDDAQIRNIAMRNPATGHPSLVLYDWECACIQLPQRDLVEFLSYALSERISDADILALFEDCRAQLARDSGKKVDPRAWLEGCVLSIYDLHVNRMACQLVLHLTLTRVDIARVFRASLRILGVLQAALAGKSAAAN